MCAVSSSSSSSSCGDRASVCMYVCTYTRARVCVCYTAKAKLSGVISGRVYSTACLCVGASRSKTPITHLVWPTHELARLGRPAGESSLLAITSSRRRHGRRELSVFLASPAVAPTCLCLPACPVLLSATSPRRLQSWDQVCRCPSAGSVTGQSV